MMEERTENSHIEARIVVFALLRDTVRNLFAPQQWFL